MIYKDKKKIVVGLTATKDALEAVMLMSGIAKEFAASILLLPILKKGMDGAAEFFKSTSGSIKTVLDKIMEIPVTNPTDTQRRVEIFSKVAQAMQTIADMGLKAGKLALVGELLEDGGMQKMFDGMSGFLDATSKSITATIDQIVKMGSGLSTASKEGIEAIASAIGAIAQLASALFAPLEVVKELSDGVFEPSVTEVMGSITKGISDLLIEIEISLPAVLRGVVNLAKEITDPEDLRPKIDLLVSAVGIVATFSKSLGDALKGIPTVEKEGGGKIYEMGVLRQILLGKDITEGKGYGPQGLLGLMETILFGINQMAVGDVSSLSAKSGAITSAMGAISSFVESIDKLKNAEVPTTIPAGFTNAVTLINQLATAETGGFKSLNSAMSLITIDTRKLEKLNNATEALSKIKSFNAAVGQTIASYNELNKQGTSNLAQGVQAMVESAKSSIEALNSIGELNATVALDNFAKAIGTNKSEFKITNEPINITLNVQVTMDANKIGEVLIDKSAMTKPLATAQG
jgi:hypothetical protein